jgi:D-glycero-D-manno-heptose 1,7-bisphosphate phosphatase
LSKQLVILDRDGCINAMKTTTKYVYRDIDFEIFPDAIDFVKRCLNANKRLAIATNQRGISQGLYSLEDTITLHALFLSEVGSTENDIPIFICPHQYDECNCRKPKPGLLISAMEYFEVERHDTIFVGDNESDRLAAINAKIDFKQIVRGTGYNNLGLIPNDETYISLLNDSKLWEIVL